MRLSRTSCAMLSRRFQHARLPTEAALVQTFRDRVHLRLRLRQGDAGPEPAISRDRQVALAVGGILRDGRVDIGRLAIDVETAGRDRPR